jgi:cell division protein FtsN
MSDKPSLYVVEKKEVVILVVLFVLVTVLSFTLGVRYGESVGKKTAHEQEVAAKEHGEAVGDAGGGTLGKAVPPESHEEHGEAKHDEHGGAPEAHGDHAAPAEHDPKHDTKKETKSEEHGEAKSPDSHSPESAAKAPSHGGESAPREAIDKNSDEYLLNALKEAGVEPPGGKAPKSAKLPDEVKEPASPSRPRVVAGSYVIQVGSHPTRSEAESQVRQLRARRVSAEILPPFKDRQGEWHRVVIGSYKNKRDADKEAAGLKGKGSIVSFFVWRLP